MKGLQFYNLREDGEPTFLATEKLPSILTMSSLTLDLLKEDTNFHNS